MIKEINGIAASEGIAIAKAYSLETPNLLVEKRIVTDSSSELERFHRAIEVAIKDLENLRETTRQNLGEDKAEIFAAHILILNDPELVNPVKDSIKENQVNAEYALQEVSSMFINMFELMDNEYMKERASDIRDVTKRVLANLLNVTISNPSSISEEVIIIAEDLTPSDTAQLSREFVKGFTTDIGGRTSHSAIMARSMEIPAVVGAKIVTETIKTGDLLIIDGEAGKVIVNPSLELIEEYKDKQSSLEKLKAEQAKLRSKKTVSADGHEVELAANIGSPEDIKGVLENRAEGVGLYRTEFLYMGREQLPTEEEQFNAYKSVLTDMEGKPVVVRTLDIGGDKELPY